MGCTLSRICRDDSKSKYHWLVNTGGGRVAETTHPVNVIFVPSLRCSPPREAIGDQLGGDAELAHRGPNRWTHCQQVVYVKHIRRIENETRKSHPGQPDLSIRAVISIKKPFQQKI